MPENMLYPPEGLRPVPVFTLSQLKSAQEQQTVLEAVVQRCDTDHALHLSLNGIPAVIPRQEVVAPWISGSSRGISALSRVGKETCFTVKQVYADAKGAPVALLSRRAAQEKAMGSCLARLRPGTILTCRVLRMEPFGAFLDVGCGIVAILPVDCISISRIRHPKERFRPGQRILAAIKTMDLENRRITMTQRELLGTWLENASYFQAGETVRGMIRSVQDYGCFVELMPNLSGLTDARTDLSPGDAVSVLIRSIRPERMKLKLQVIDILAPPETPEPLQYFITDGVLERWVYSPPCCIKTPVETDFTAF